jgi:hypothetical protein
VLSVEVVLLVALIIGWRFGARRLDIRLHHRVVYLLILSQLIIIILWMAPRALAFITSSAVAYLNGDLFLILASLYPNINLLQFIPASSVDPSINIITLHSIVGLITVGLGVALITIFLLRPEMPLKLLRRGRPLMITTFIIFIIVFVVGVILFLHFEMGVV